MIAYAESDRAGLAEGTSTKNLKTCALRGESTLEEREHRGEKRTTPKSEEKLTA